MFFLVEVSLPPFDMGHEGTQRAGRAKGHTEPVAGWGTQPGFLFPAHQAPLRSQVHRPRRNPGLSFLCRTWLRVQTTVCSRAVRVPFHASHHLQTVVSAAPVWARQRGHETRARLAELKPKRGLAPGPEAPQDEGTREVEKESPGARRVQKGISPRGWQRGS